MLDQNDISKIKKEASNFFQIATISLLKIEVQLATADKNDKENNGLQDNGAVNLDIEISDPQILIGERGQTLFEIQKLLKIVLNKKIGKNFYLNLDINNYKRKKADYLKEVAKSAANEVYMTRTQKIFPPMSAYERRVIHTELSDRQDVFVESSGEGEYRHIVIKPK